MKKREQNIEQLEIEKKKIPKLQKLSTAIRIKCSWHKKNKKWTFWGHKKACPLSRFLEILGKSKCTKESEINKARKLPENILAKNT